MREKRIWLSLFLVAMLLVSAIFVAGCGQDEEPDDVGSDDDEEGEVVAGEPQYGGIIDVAMARTIVHLDTDHTTDSYFSVISNHIYEGLFEIDENYMPQPYLAESYSVEDDGTSYRIKLREGVLFHNGKEMTSADVYASINRWLAINGGGKGVAQYVEEIEVLGDYEIVIKLNQIYAPFLSIVSSTSANQKLIIRSLDTIEEYGEEVIEEHIGTGPYMLKEYAADQYVALTKFEDYVPHDGSPFAYYGEKKAYADEIIFWFVPEVGVRVSGVKTGEYDFADIVSLELYDSLLPDPEVETHIVSPARQSFIIINQGNPPMDNLYIRQALLYALDESIMGASMIGFDDFWELDPSLFPPGNLWHTPNVGAGVYGSYDPEKAMELMEMGGYDGTPLIILSGRDDEVESRGSLTAKELLEDVGFVVDVQLYDRATVVEQRSRLDGYHLHFSQFATPSADPQAFGAWMGTNKWIGNWDDEDSVKMDEIFSRMGVEIDYDKRLEIVREWNEAFYQYVPYVKLFNFSELVVSNKKLQNYQTFIWPTFFNTWLDE
jgi:peptide/nickel transport system substrate-binding protein